MLIEDVKKDVKDVLDKYNLAEKNGGIKVKTKTWYVDEKGVRYYINDKKKCNGKIRYNVTDGYGERMYGLSFSDIKKWKNEENK